MLFFFRLLAVITSSFHLYSLLLIVVVLVNDHDDVILTGTLKGEVVVIAHPHYPYMIGIPSFPHNILRLGDAQDSMLGFGRLHYAHKSQATQREL